MRMANTSVEIPHFKGAAASYFAADQKDQKPIQKEDSRETGQGTGLEPKYIPFGPLLSICPLCSFAPSHPF